LLIHIAKSHSLKKFFNNTKVDYNVFSRIFDIIDVDRKQPLISLIQPLK